MANGGGDDGLIRPDTLRRLAAEKEMERLKEALRRQQKVEEERAAFHRWFETEEVRLEEARRVVSAMVAAPRRTASAR